MASPRGKLITGPRPICTSPPASFARSTFFNDAKAAISATGSASALVESNARTREKRRIIFVGEETKRAPRCQRRAGAVALRGGFLETSRAHARARADHRPQRTQESVPRHARGGWRFDGDSAGGN